MPFRSKSQVSACFAQNSPDWDCHKWAKETKNIKNLPKKLKKEADLKITSSFQKIAKALFNPRVSPPVPTREKMKQAIDQEKITKRKGLSPVEYRNQLTRRRSGIVQKNVESAKGA